MGRLLFLRFWPLLKFLVFLFKIFPSFVHSFFWSLTTSFSGVLATLFRYLSFSSRLKFFDKNIYIGTHVILKNIHNMEVGKNFSLHDLSYVDAQGGVKIGNNVSIAHNCSLITFNHTWDNHDLPIKYNPTIKASITIEDDVWIGCGVRIMPGVVLGSRSVIAAGSVVVKNVPSTILVGCISA